MGRFRKIFASLALVLFGSILAYLFFLQTNPSCPSSIRPVFSPGSESVFIGLAGNSKKGISAELYQFSYSPLLEELVRAAGRGVKVRVILDRTVDSNYPTAKALSEGGVEVRIASRNFERVHSKFGIFDEAVLVGSTNWSFHAMFLNREAAVVLKDDSSLLAFERVFGEDWASSEPFIS